MKPEEVLEIHQLSKTQVRLETIMLLMNRDYALAEHEIKAQLAGDYDRTTIYRTLKTFLKYAIIHRIVDENSTARYVLNKELTRQSADYYKEHIHFKCERCGRLFCLEDIPVKRYQLPEGFTRKKSEFLIVGICQECNKKIHSG